MRCLRLRSMGSMYRVGSSPKAKLYQTSDLSAQGIGPRDFGDRNAPDFRVLGSGAGTKASLTDNCSRKEIAIRAVLYAKHMYPGSTYIPSVFSHLTPNLSLRS